MTKTFTKTVIAALTVATLTISANSASANGMNTLAGVEAGTAIESVGFFKKGGRFTNRGAATIGLGAAVVGGLLANKAIKSRNNTRERRYYEASRQDRHFDWCYSKYRSYDHRSDTYISRRYGETYCNSPYN